MRAIILATALVAVPLHAEPVSKMRARPPAAEFDTTRSAASVVECMMLATDTPRKAVEPQMIAGGAAYAFPVKAGPFTMPQGLVADVIEGPPVRVRVYTFKGLQTKAYAAAVNKMRTCRE